MRKLNLSGILALIAFTFGSANSIQAQSTTAIASKWTGACSVKFEGKSTLHDFDGTVDCQPFTVTIENSSTPEKATASAVVVAEASKMDTADKKRDVKMHESLDVTTYPTIKVNVDGLTPSETKPKMGGPIPQPTVIPFELTLKGKTHQMKGSVSNWSYAADKITCTVSFPISLKTAGITVPSVMKIIKVKDEIQVHANLTLKPKK